MSDSALSTQYSELPLYRRGKVRDVFDMGDKLLIVSTDRLSAFDVVLPDPIPLKGQVLTQLSAWWFEQTKDVMPNHVISMDVPEAFAGRGMIVRKAQRVDIEAVVRGYLVGTGWSAYQKGEYSKGEYHVPPGIPFCGKLPEPIFTPTTKADEGHDMPMTFAEVENQIGAELARKVRDASLTIYRYAAERCEPRGIILADTKFEFGLVEGELILIDELLTPDSSRYWPADKYETGKNQESFDKQYVRDYLETTGWDKTPPAPKLPDEVIAKTTERYVECYERVTGQTFAR
ncbi:MAG TPA: phosphoribosylaminoimidazolesuccinocarboxamide synthase [Chloroflexota bacterium]|nr:phosphoribosylaminoimidazolesuccinocarboxamide synthase [Chloroflexota bacterium]